MKKIKNILSFFLIYLVIFILILNLQYVYRFDSDSDFFTLLMYSSIFSITFSMIPLFFFGVSWFILNILSTKALHIKSILKPALIFLITVISTYTFMEIMYNDSFLSIITTISTVLTLISLFYINLRGNNKVLI
ncbi:hypothetical protein FITA111629_15600 [Filibacter tadaridae]|uniref:Uncharacterized protein n=1 Tax=Filibacter tadaridae TaxID=2483811 RepID=A0A3P5XXQ0_9BACL|nr:hypothetical protein FILTAD_03088 [Filibacter tadaridae]